MPLLVELVPATSWGDNLRRRLRPVDWTRLRQETYALANHRCEVCGGQGQRNRVEAHERWEYDDTKHIQKLVGLESLCPRCHEVRHIGRAFAIGHGPKARAQLMKVNGWTLEKAQAHIDKAFELHAVRSKHRWELDLSWLDGKGYRLL